MMKIYEIAPGLLQSARTHTLSDAECVDLITRYKVTGVVNLWHTPDPWPGGPGRGDAIGAILRHRRLVCP